MSGNSYNNVGILRGRVCVSIVKRWCWEIYRMRDWERGEIKCDRCEGSHGMASKIAVDGSLDRSDMFCLDCLYGDKTN